MRFLLKKIDELNEEEIDEFPLYEYVESDEELELEEEYDDFIRTEDEYRICFKKRISCYDHDLALCLKKVLDSNLAKNSTLKKGFYLLNTM